MCTYHQKILKLCLQIHLALRKKVINANEIKNVIAATSCLKANDPCPYYKLKECCFFGQNTLSDILM
jgi:hypothetical protein